jgi:hypothetical protein
MVSCGRKKEGNFQSLSRQTHIRAHLDVNMAPGGGREGFQRTLHNAKLHVGVQRRLKFMCTHTYAHVHAQASILRAESSLSGHSAEVGTSINASIIFSRMMSRV